MISLLSYWSNKFPSTFSYNARLSDYFHFALASTEAKDFIMRNMMLFFGPLFPVATGHILRVEGFGTEKRNGRCRFDHVRSFSSALDGGIVKVRSAPLSQASSRRSRMEWPGVHPADSLRKWHNVEVTVHLVWSWFPSVTAVKQSSELGQIDIHHCVCLYQELVLAKGRQLPLEKGGQKKYHAPPDEIFCLGGGGRDLERVWNFSMSWRCWGKFVGYVQEPRDCWFYPCNCIFKLWDDGIGRCWFLFSLEKHRIVNSYHRGTVSNCVGSSISFKL